ncbi:hypothetical protein BSKO_11224 [Bryopsis sp. KO-2023]|nr:hypothetical protein BSKO_11224 [Bryopsis sp. KO-2023]
MKRIVSRPGIGKLAAIQVARRATRTSSDLTPSCLDHPLQLSLGSPLRKGHQGPEDLCQARSDRAADVHDAHELADIPHRFHRRLRSWSAAPCPPIIISSTKLRPSVGCRILAKRSCRRPGEHTQP